MSSQGGGRGRRPDLDYALDLHQNNTVLSYVLVLPPSLPREHIEL